MSNSETVIQCGYDRYCYWCAKWAEGQRRGGSPGMSFAKFRSQLSGEDLQSLAHDYKKALEQTTVDGKNTITLSREEADLIYLCLSLYGDEINYQLNDSPLEHDPAGIGAWEDDEERCAGAMAILGAKLYPDAAKESNDDGL